MINFIKNYLIKETVTIEYLKDIGMISFKYKDKEHTIYFPYNHSQARRFVNYGITYVKDGRENKFNLFPGCSLPYTAEQCGYDKFVIYDYISDEKREVDTIDF